MPTSKTHGDVRDIQLAQELSKNKIVASFTKNYDGSIDFEIGKNLVDITIQFKNIAEVHEVIFMALQNLYNNEGNIIRVKKIE